MNWNPNSVSNLICRVTWCIFIHHLPYHKKWIRYELRQALAIFRFCMLSIKLVMLLHFILLKLLQSWARLTLFGNFLFVFCAFGCLTFLPFLHEPFLILGNVKRDFCFATAFHCCLLILHSVFCSLILEAFTLINVVTKVTACIWKFVLQVGCFLLPFSLLKYFLSQT